MSAADWYEGRFGGVSGSRKYENEDQYTQAKIAALEPLEKEMDRDEDTAASPVSDEEWINTLAFHLACEPMFISWMQNPAFDDYVYFFKHWLASVYLRGRYQYYDDFEAWFKAWWSHQERPGENNRRKVIQAAKEMFWRVEGRHQSKIEDNLSELPENDPHTQKLRRGLFSLNTTRQKISLLVKSYTDLQFGHANRLRGVLQSVRETGWDEETRDLLEELGRIEDSKEECRAKLASAQLPKVGRAFLRELMSGLGARNPKSGTLFLMGDEARIDLRTPSVNPTQDEVSQQPLPVWPAVPNVNEVQKKLKEMHAIELVFVDGHELGGVDPFQFRTPKTLPFKSIVHSEPVFDKTICGAEELSQYDAEATEWFKKETERVDKKRFVLNYRTFEDVLKRPESCKRYTPGSSAWQNPRYWLDVLEDNLVHIRSMVNQLYEWGLIDAEVQHEQGKLQDTLEAMYALVALAYGCWREPALLCSIMDSLLEELAGFIVGHQDPKLESHRMINILEAVRINKAGTIPDVLPEIDDTKLEKEHQARELFAEIARFYRGAVIMAVGAAAVKKGSQSKEETKLWYDELVGLNSICGHRSCREQLEVKFSDVAKTRRWTLSVAVDDGRLGFPDQRAFVSSNRACAYWCLYCYICHLRYQVGLGVFFHYFAHLWHPVCRPFRGKPGMLEDFTIMDKLSQSTAGEDVEMADG